MKRARHLGALLVATLVAAAGLVVLGQGPASAAWCSDGGVNVVVDYNSLGGGVAKGCAPSGGGKSASAIFVEAGFPLSYAQRQPGFVCRVSGKPASDPCVNASPANAYWGLFHSDGKSGKWTYANLGVGGLKVPEGGFVAFAFQDSNTTHQPDATPMAPAKPTPTPTPTKPATTAPVTPKPGGAGGSTAPQPGKKPSTKATRTAAAQPTASPSGRPSVTSPTPSLRASASASSTPTAAASISPSDPAPSEPSTDPTDSTGSAEAATTTATKAGSAGEKHSGLPVWVPVSVVLVLVAAAGVAVLLRRRGNP